MSEPIVLRLPYITGIKPVEKMQWQVLKFLSLIAVSTDDPSCITYE